MKPRLLLTVLGVGVVIGFAATEMAHAVKRSAALEMVSPAADSARLERALRVPLEEREDSLRAVVEAQAVALRANSVRWARELSEADRRVRVATVRASSLADSVRVRVDSATAVFLDAHLAEDLVTKVALTRQVEILRSENVALWGNLRTLEELVTSKDQVESSLRAELALKDAIIKSQARALDPPFSVEFFDDAKVAIPALAVGIGIGVVASG